MILEQTFSPKSIKIGLESTDKDELFEELLETIVAVNPGIDRTEALEALRKREAKMSTGIIHRVAIPHANVKSAKGLVGAVGISKNGIDYDALDNKKVNLIFLMLCNPDDAESHLKVMKSLSNLLCNQQFISEIIDASSCIDAFEILKRYENQAEHSY